MPSSALLTTLDVADGDFESRFDALLDRDGDQAREIESTVAAIIDDVRVRGDAALLDYTRRFDHRPVESVADLEVGRGQLADFTARLPDDQVRALRHAAERVRSFHERQKEGSWTYDEADGSRYGQLVTPLERVGVYVPGGKAAYPSSVLMNVVPARVAGVSEVVMVVPTPGGETNPIVMAAADIAGVDRVFTIGGAQAVAALAYGTGLVPPVDKIVGPGNIYVATAKRQVFGRVGIDMIAGPSEVVVVCDRGADPDWVAMDLFAQAEHDEMAQSIVICDDREFLARVLASVERLLPEMERAEVIRAALAGQGAAILTGSMSQSLELCNRIAPEHLELQVADPQAILPMVRNAGAVFAGYHSAESLGDYCAGPNHVLPTAGTARFSSPLGVYDFQKRSSLIMCSPQGARDLAGTASVLARAERLTAHARSAEYRGAADS